ncbi:type II toxin-antitoxin system PemK/MazF family toxin [Brevibacillus fluminis]|uniref:type II toxin-antitoxin system PemK/MazF family toxin n=1 Tax=Brevibacillus fluminis TaxID=511487 RepID=UPI003F8CC08B
MVNVGDIFWFEVTYPRTGEKAVRPVVIIDMDDGNPVIATFAAITGSSIKDFEDRYDKWQVPLFSWKQAGLLKESYCKANCVATVEANVFRSANFIGVLHRNDFKSVLKRVEEFINSGEAPW